MQIQSISRFVNDSKFKINILNREQATNLFNNIISALGIISKTS
jgi:hypothetical protein